MQTSTDSINQRIKSKLPNNPHVEELTKLYFETFKQTLKDTEQYVVESEFGTFYLKEGNIVDKLSMLSNYIKKSRDKEKKKEAKDLFQLLVRRYQAKIFDYDRKEKIIKGEEVEPLIKHNKILYPTWVKLRKLVEAMELQKSTKKI